MGTEKRKHRRSSEPDSPQQDEVKRKKHKREKDEKREKKKEKEHKSHKSSKRHSDKEKSGEKHKSKSYKHRSKSSIGELSKDDYFSKNNEFATWLKEKKKIFFTDLSSEAAHDLFMDFVKEWNKGKLASEYYEGIATGPRSSHNWNIKQ